MKSLHEKADLMPDAWRLSFLSSFVSVFLYFPHNNKQMELGRLENGLPIWQLGSPLASPSLVLCFTFIRLLRRYHKLIPLRWVDKIL